MNNERLQVAKQEALRFLAKVEELEKINHREYYSSVKQNGAVKRASMDLTRSLAELRKL